jgi:hypothetical protein
VNHNNDDYDNDINTNTNTNGAAEHIGEYKDDRDNESNNVGVGGFVAPEARPPSSVKRPLLSSSIEAAPTTLAEVEPFERMIRSSGGILTIASYGAHLVDDPASFRLSLERKLRQPAAALSFLTGCEHYINTDEASFRKLMLHTQTRTPHRSSSSSSPYSAKMPGSTSVSSSGSRGGISHMHVAPQDSLMRLFLGVQALQKPLADLLMEKLPEYMNPQSSSSSSRQYAATGQASTPELILSQLRWLDIVYDARGISLKLLEVVNVCPDNIKRDVIAAIPEIVDDSSHKEIVETLTIMMNENSELTVPILDALSNLSLPPRLAAAVRTEVLSTLSSASLDDLPVVIRFVLQSADKESAIQVIYPRVVHRHHL